MKSLRELRRVEAVQVRDIVGKSLELAKHSARHQLEWPLLRTSRFSADQREMCDVFTNWWDISPRRVGR